MAKTRNLETNQNKTAKALERIEKDATKSIARDYKNALALIRAELLKRIERFGKLNNENLSKFSRREKLFKDINDILTGLFRNVNRKIRRNSDIQVKQGYFRNAYCVDTNLGVALKWKIGKNFKEQIK